MSKKKKTNNKSELFDFMKQFDDPELSDGAWQSVLEDSVKQFNDANGTNHDPFESWLAYAQRN